MPDPGDSATPALAPPESPPAIAALVTRIDTTIGVAELALAGFCLAVLILAGAYQAIATNFLSSGAQWPYDLIHNALYLIAAAGAAFAAHKHQQISMDVLSQRFSLRARAYLDMIIAAFVIALCIALIVRGLDVYQVVTSTESDTPVVPTWVRAATFPTAAGLIALHYFLHSIVAVAYLVAGRVPPRPEEEAMPG